MLYTNDYFYSLPAPFLQPPTLMNYLHNILSNYKDWVQLIKVGKEQSKRVSKCSLNKHRLYSKSQPPVSAACGSNISANVFLIKAAAAARMNMVRIHRQISPFPPTLTYTLKHTHSHKLTYVNLCTPKKHASTHFFLWVHAFLHTVKITILTVCCLESFFIADTLMKNVWLNVVCII